jgi:hypothetical protein
MAVLRAGWRADGLGACYREFRRMYLMKLSEKGFEQRSERGFGRYTDHEMGQKELLGSP